MRVFSLTDDSKFTAWTTTDWVVDYSPNGKQLASAGNDRSSTYGTRRLANGKRSSMDTARQVRVVTRQALATAGFKHVHLCGIEKRKLLHELTELAGHLSGGIAPNDGHSRLADGAEPSGLSTPPAGKIRDNRS